MKIFTIRDADAYERLWSDLEGREEGDARGPRLLMDWLADMDTTPLCVQVTDDAVAAEIAVAIESMAASTDEGAEGVSLKEC